MDFLFASPVVPWLIAAAILYFAWNGLAPRLKLGMPGLSAEGLKARMMGDQYETDRIDKQAAREKKATQAGKVEAAE